MTWNEIAARIALMPPDAVDRPALVLPPPDAEAPPGGFWPVSALGRLNGGPDWALVAGSGAYSAVSVAK